MSKPIRLTGLDVFERPVEPRFLVPAFHYAPAFVRRAWFAPNAGERGECRGEGAAGRTILKKRSIGGPLLFGLVVIPGSVISHCRPVRTASGPRCGAESSVVRACGGGGKKTACGVPVSDDRAAVQNTILSPTSRDEGHFVCVTTIIVMPSSLASLRIMAFRPRRRVSGIECRRHLVRTASALASSPERGRGPPLLADLPESGRDRGPPWPHYLTSRACARPRAPGLLGAVSPFHPGSEPRMAF